MSYSDEDVVGKVNYMENISPFYKYDQTMCWYEDGMWIQVALCPVVERRDKRGRSGPSVTLETGRGLLETGVKS